MSRVRHASSTSRAIMPSQTALGRDDQTRPNIRFRCADPGGEVGRLISGRFSSLQTTTIIRARGVGDSDEDEAARDSR
jgi:hypothetical protein